MFTNNMPSHLGICVEKDSQSRVLREQRKCVVRLEVKEKK